MEVISAHESQSTGCQSNPTNCLTRGYPSSRPLKDAEKSAGEGQEGRRVGNKDPGQWENPNLNMRKQQELKKFF